VAISGKCDRVSALLGRIKRYDAIIRNNNFTGEALAEMKQNCREIIRETSMELREILREVNSL